MRNWSELIPEALELIFNDLSVEERLRVVPLVCKSWGRAVQGQYCWQDIDVKEWSKNWTPELFEPVVRLLIMRSNGSLCKLAVTGLPTDALFSFIADNASSLHTLLIPGSRISDSIVEQVAGRLSNITTLDLSYCSMIGAKALEAFGKNCKYLSVLKHEVSGHQGNLNEEPFAIAATMPNLQHLELLVAMSRSIFYNGNLSDVGVLEILAKCSKLKFLDIRGCLFVELNEMMLKDKYPNVEVLQTKLSRMFADFMR